MKKIKIAHVLHSIGGVEVYLDLVIKNIDSNTIENIIIHGEKEKVKEYFNISKQPVKQFFIPIKREINVINDIRCIYQTIKILKKEKPNIIHAHSAKGGIIARIASLFYKVNVLHTPHAYSYLSSNSQIKRFIFLKIEKIFKNFNSILLATSESELNRGIKEVGYSVSRALLFNNSIKPILAKEKNTSIISSLPENYICTVGRPSYQKNIEMMVKIIKEVKKTIPDIHLVVMGLGVVSPNTENVKRLIVEYKLEENTTLIEWIEREKIFDIVKNSKFYISTARYEGLPYAIIESLALKKSLIASDCDGNKDLVKNNYNGYLININEIDLFVEKVIELYNNTELREKFENNSFIFFEENFNLNINIKCLEKIYIKYSNLNK
ncbi:Glycosyltransferase involved in cell wall bisynthesis [Flaviramulus basaltis]|uniref:Glycosyltransferase involved in cell wall bisynthesis n=1 Tax=Flaviramulus basaltis TaxID=369401 RepID=A0A1K2ICW7_9FLAO|nr:glycosyltransferase [Flaviramulus basaltis]SFZ90114.1 Glycosyltransferase involved in cell wall bisynthesis [Flaviramulus basaltis]